MTGSPQQRPLDIVLFDLGSTLLYFDADWAEVTVTGTQALARTLRSLGYQVDLHTFASEYAQMQSYYYLERDTSWTEVQVEDVLRELLTRYAIPAIPLDHVHLALDAMYEIYESYWRLEADAVSTLETIRSEGYQTGLVSNAGYGRDLDRLLDIFDLRAYFQSIVISAYAGVRKPHPEIFDHALAPFGAVDRKRVVMVGDLLGADVLGAQNAGIGSIWINRRASPRLNRTFYDQVIPDAVVQTLAEIPTCLQNWGRPGSA